MLCLLSHVQSKMSQARKGLTTNNLEHSRNHQIESRCQSYIHFDNNAVLLMIHLDYREANIFRNKVFCHTVEKIRSPLLTGQPSFALKVFSVCFRSEKNSIKKQHFKNAVSGKDSVTQKLQCLQIVPPAANSFLGQVL